MLKLKKLQILGFKSFCDRTEVNFHGEGIAAIVGPNGCGKSNISDAISWVLGEQSAKTLRGARMEDVIFAGTRERKPTGMAEVSLTLIDPAAFDGDPLTAFAVDVHNELPAVGGDDWDEATLRARAVEDTEAAVAEVQPLGPEEAGASGVAPWAADSIADPAEGAAGAHGTTDGDGAGVSAESIAGADSANPVVLKIRRRKFKPAQFRAGEIVVTRRLFRSGESEYLLNGKLCRLRDIQDLFMGTGLGPESYAIIEQGRIGQILSSKPHDRRAIIEEAAGITRFKTKKRLAEARLEQAKLNLARVNDIFEEVTRQMNSLKRQSAKAERYARLREEMRAKLRIVLANKFAHMARESAELDARSAALATQMHELSEAVQSREAEHNERTYRGYAVERESTQNREQLNAITIEMERASERRRSNDERCAELQARSAAGEAEMQRVYLQVESLRAEVAANQQALETAAADAAAAQQELEASRSAAAASAAALLAFDRQQEERRAQIMAVMSTASSTRNLMIQAEEHISALDREGQRLEREMAAVMADMETFGGRRGQVGFEFESVSQRLQGLNARITDTRTQLEQKRNAETTAKQDLDSIRAEYATALGKKGSLEAVIAEHGYSTESVKRLFQSDAIGHGFAPAGVLADFLEVDDRYEGVVEDFLRDELNYVVVKSWDSADEGLRLLRNDVNGRATFLVHPNDSQAKFSFQMDEVTPPAPRRDSILPLTQCIRVLNGFGKSLEVILPKLSGGYIAPDSGLARELALENPNAFFLSPTGETFHNVTVTGGKQRSEGPLSMKRELRDVLKLATELEGALRFAQSQTQILAREIAELTELLASLEEERREAERTSMTSGAALKQMDAELARAKERMETLGSELERLRAERQEKQWLVDDKRALAAEQEQQRKMLEDQLASAQQSVTELRMARDTAAEQAALKASVLAVLEERRRTAAGGVQRIESMMLEADSRLNALQGQIDAAAAEEQQRRAENSGLEQRALVLAEERAGGETRAAELHAESEMVRGRVAELEQELKAARHELDAARDRKGELAAAAAKLGSDVEYLSQTCLNELGVPQEELCADATIGSLEPEALQAEDAAHREMRSRLEAMGPVNMMALEEYNEIAQRHGFLEGQRKDLSESIENTQNTIKEIDSISREKFTEAFHRINENFQMTFRTLFGGGQAFMRLTDEENAQESGIDVVASPPGKKLQNVLLLSGGEKALTALALLVGIFQYQPSPFCILDEVDAPLDEANVGRFNELVRQMSTETQFVLITHSKKTMSMAPVLYGVTMQEPGVSKLVSVRFGEEARLAAVNA